MTPLTSLDSAPLLCASVPNLRDLGGIAMPDGRVVAHGRLYRSSHFAAVADADAVLLQRLGLRTRIDFRGVDERAAAPSRWHGPEDVHLPIEPRALGALRERRLAGEKIDEAVQSQVLRDVYLRFVHERAPVFAALLQHLLEERRYPLVFHCTAGKDRTGFAAALVLLALGASRQTIVDDFVMSNGRWQSPKSSHDWTLLSRVRADDLHTAFDAMDTGWGGSDNYLAQVLGVGAAERDRLQALLLAEPVGA